MIFSGFAYACRTRATSSLVKYLEVSAPVKMSKVENKKGKKRPFGETHLAKPGQRQENVFGLKKNVKKPKLAVSTQNGDFKTEKRTKPFQTEKQKQQKNEKQTNNTTLPQLKEKVVAAQSKEVSQKMKEKMMDGIKKKLPKEKQQQQSPGQKLPKKELSLEQIQQRINEIQSRETLSKTATKKLLTYKKILARMTGENKSEKSTVTGKKNTQTNKQTNENVQIKKQKIGDKEKAKPKSVIEAKHEDDEDDDDDDDDTDDDDNDFDDSDSEPSESGEEEEEVEAEEEGAEEEDSEEDKSYGEGEITEEVDEEESEMELDESEDESNDDEVSDEEDDEEDEEDEADSDAESNEIAKIVVQSSKKKEDAPKKNQYSLFVKNLPNE